jgi:hypothetical protein
LAPSSRNLLGRLRGCAEYLERSLRCSRLPSQIGLIRDRIQLRDKPVSSVGRCPRLINRRSISNQWHQSDDEIRRVGNSHGHCSRRISQWSTKMRKSATSMKSQNSCAQNIALRLRSATTAVASQHASTRDRRKGSAKYWHIPHGPHGTTDARSNT